MVCFLRFVLFFFCCRGNLWREEMWDVGVGVFFIKATFKLSYESGRVELYLGYWGVLLGEGYLID